MLRHVLQALQHHRVKLRPEKCELTDSVRVDLTDVEAVQALKEKTPQTVGEVRRRLGFLSYYSIYVQDFSHIARLLYELLQIKSSSPQPKPTRGKTKGPQLPSHTLVEWNSEYQQVLERLINILTNPPVLAYPDFNHPFILRTDASQQGLGVVLYQNQDGKMRVISRAKLPSPQW